MAKRRWRKDLKKADKEPVKVLEKKDPPHPLKGFKDLSDASTTECSECGKVTRTVGYFYGESDDVSDGGPELGSVLPDGRPLCLDCTVNLHKYPKKPQL